MNGWEFRDPWILLLSVLAVPAYLLLTRRTARIKYSSLQLLQGLPRTWRMRLTRLPAILLGLATVLLVIALAGPRTPDAQTRVNREGISMVAVVDRSSSMNARDMVKDDTSIDRLDVVKDVFKQFVLGDREQGVSGRPDDMVGLVAFAGYADSLSPLTLDHGNLTTIVEDLEIVNQRDEDGTAVGDGLALAVERLRRNSAVSKIVILLTDGVSNAGVVSPKDAADLAATHQIKVYCIGVGTTGLAPIPTQNPFSGRVELRAVPVEIDEDTLKDVAQRTGGRYYRATDREVLQDIYREIDQLERSEISEIRYLNYTEHYQGFVLSGLSLLAVGCLLQRTALRRLP